MDSLVEENYLKALFYLSDKKGEVSVNALAKQLDVKMPTVTSMIQKLATKGLVDYRKYRPIGLTKTGRNKAATIIRKHRLTEMFLVEKMGFGWEEVHDIAEQIEHVDSPAFFRKMDEILGHPLFDPHGSPIPDRDGKIHRKAYRSLSECEQGDQLTLMAVTDSSDAFLRFLNGKQLALDTGIEVLSVESYDGSMTVSYDKRQEVFSKSVCDKLLVTKGGNA
jgi:DtxR family Mn-dependent transcriptional regulator